MILHEYNVRPAAGGDFLIHKPGTKGKESTELSANSHQDPETSQSKHNSNDCLDSKREAVPDGSVKPLVVEGDDKGGNDAKHVHYGPPPWLIWGSCRRRTKIYRIQNHKVNMRTRDGEYMDVRDRCHHLGTVCCEAARDGELRPVEVFFDSETEPQ